MKSGFRRGGHRRLLTKARHILSLLLGIPLLLAGCSKSAVQASATVTDKEITPQQAHVGPITVSFHVNNGAGRPVSGARVSLEGDMTHPGMAPVFGEAREVAPGQYQGQLTLNMAGDWVVLMHIALPDGHNLEDEIDVRGVQNR